MRINTNIALQLDDMELDDDETVHNKLEHQLFFRLLYLVKGEQLTLDMRGIGKYKTKINEVTLGRK